MRTRDSLSKMTVIVNIVDRNTISHRVDFSWTNWSLMKNKQFEGLEVLLICTVLVVLFLFKSNSLTF